MWTQAKIYVAAAMLIVWSAVLLYLGFQGGRASGAAREASLLSKQMDAVLSEQAEQAKRAEKLQKTLDRMPRPSNTIREVVRENPSGCVLAPAVVDSLREAIREGNGARKVP